MKLQADYKANDEDNTRFCLIANEGHSVCFIYYFHFTGVECTTYRQNKSYMHEPVFFKASDTTIENKLFQQIMTMFQYFAYTAINQVLDVCPGFLCALVYEFRKKVLPCFGYNGRLYQSFPFKIDSFRLMRMIHLHCIYYYYCIYFTANVLFLSLIHI